MKKIHMHACLPQVNLYQVDFNKNSMKILFLNLHFKEYTENNQ